MGFSVATDAKTAKEVQMLVSDETIFHRDIRHLTLSMTLYEMSKSSTIQFCYIQLKLTFLSQMLEFIG